MNENVLNLPSLQLTLQNNDTQEENINNTLSSTPSTPTTAIESDSALEISPVSKSPVTPLRGFLRRNSEQSAPKLVRKNFSSPTLGSRNKTKPLRRKIIELGCNWGGKTTLFKSAKMLFGGGFSEVDRVGFRDIIYSNILYSMRLLMENALQDISTPKSEKQFIKTYGSEILDMFADFSIERTALHKVPTLWQQKSIQKAYSYRNTTFHIPEIEKFCNDMPRISEDEYMPNELDVLCSRVKTTGIVYSDFVENGYEVELIDVGSERNERKKWFSCFDQVTDLMYVVGADEFDMLCYEDNETNRLQESLNCWIEMINSQYFTAQKTNVFLVFNKIDLFMSKMMTQSVDLSQFFKGYKPALFASDPVTEAHRALSFLINKFLGAVSEKRKIHVCLTNAIDMQCMRRFWKAVLSVPLRTQRTDDVDVDYFLASRLEEKFEQNTQDQIIIAEEWWWDATYSQSSSEYSQFIRRKRQRLEAMEQSQFEMDRSLLPSIKYTLGNIWNTTPSPLGSPRSTRTSSSTPNLSAYRQQLPTSLASKSPRHISNVQLDGPLLTRKPNNITSYPVGFIDATGLINSLQYSDLSIASKEKSNVHLRVHSFILAVRCPLFYDYIVQLQKYAPFTEVVVIDEMNLIQLKHIVSFIYSNQPYPFTCIGALDGRESSVIASLNARFKFMRKDNTIVLKKKKKMLRNSIKKISNAINSVTSGERRKRSNSLSDEKTPTTPTFFNKLKKKIGEKVKQNTLAMPETSLYHSAHVSPIDIMVIDPNEDITMERITWDLFSAFANMNNYDIDFETPELDTLPLGHQPDLVLHGVGWDSHFIKAHKFICAAHMPDLRKNDFSMLTFYNYRSYFCVISYLYGADFKSMLDSGWMSEDGSATCMDIVHMLHISRLWDLDREYELFDILLSRMSKILTPSMVFTVLKIFERDEIDLSQFIPQRYHRRNSLEPDQIPTLFVKNKKSIDECFDEESSIGRENDIIVGITHPNTCFAILPPEILFHIFTYLAPKPLSQQSEVIEASSPSSILSDDIDIVIPIDESSNFTVNPSWTHHSDYRMLNQDALTFLLFTSIEFIHYMAKNYREYLVIKQESFGHFALVRNVCYEYMAKTWNIIQQLPEWKESNNEIKKQVRDLLAEEHPSSIFK
jgi:guanine nucleotide-binding protein G(i) subunit alpha